ncbi:hypothetical protein EVAR_7889_1 [Eumeta japonica]|uniref:Uncharacterized protein n=1 Tax=Eumeta variegata TaxID=151549 RepID=A0A4C1TW39_EUMVA|nr:hypothetical protein EVAR_7889_1 [Eumeta japonica]
MPVASGRTNSHDETIRVPFLPFWLVSLKIDIRKNVSTLARVIIDTRHWHCRQVAGARIEMVMSSLRSDRGDFYVFARPGPPAARPPETRRYAVQILVQRRRRM